jgi:hypothetical protein
MSVVRPATSSGRKTADAAICARPALLKSIILEGDGTNACNVIIYDNASAASGNVLAKLLIQASGPQVVSFDSAGGIEANNGLYADVTGTGAAYIVHYSIE